MPEPSDTDWAYAAGFVDGEGCIAVVRSFVPFRGRYYYGVQVVVANRDRDVLGWMQNVWGGHVVGVSSRPARARENLDVEVVQWFSGQEELYWIQRELNHRGTAAFVKRPMHSPRQINRDRAALKLAQTAIINTKQ